MKYSCHFVPEGKKNTLVQFSVQNVFLYSICAFDYTEYGEMLLKQAATVLITNGNA